MDWHFRRNRKERETEGRGAHRRWLPRADEWIHENSEAGPSEPKQEAVASTKLTAERLAALKRKWVRAPEDPAKATIPCPICKEQFKSEWSEDEEEWVFNNAINVHGTVSSLPLCRADARSSTLRAAPRR
jgi:pre-mRNA cleavage complex 2 protein Pcf11